jgi:hypothetical protein
MVARNARQSLLPKLGLKSMRVDRFRDFCRTFVEPTAVQTSFDNDATRSDDKETINMTTTTKEARVDSQREVRMQIRCLIG